MRNFHLLFAGLVGAFLASSGAAAPLCEPGQGFTVADFSAPFTDLDNRNGRSAADELRRIGIDTIIRYYDHPDETLPCKTLVPGETNAILAAGFGIAVVFQHNNDDPLTFLNGRRGLDDGERAMELAHANGQPEGSVIYFGVDGVDEAIRGANYQYNKNKGGALTQAQVSEMTARMGAGNFRKHAAFYEAYRSDHATWFEGAPGQTLPEAILPFLAQYFADIDTVFRDYGGNYRLGAYGSGLVCDFLITGGYVDMCWLAQSTGWPGYEAFSASRLWSLRQQLVTSCPGWNRRSGGVVSFDFNEIGPAGDFGQWRTAQMQVGNFTPPVRKAGVGCYVD